MDICSHLAPNGEKSLLYQQLEEKFGPKVAHDAWDEVRTQQFLNKHGDWTKQKENAIEFEEDQSTGYRARTIKNASADATIALATDFTSAGEKLTRSSVEGQGKKYIPLDASSFTLLLKPESIDKIVDKLNDANAKTLNIAGNGIYTMKGVYSQKEVDDNTYKLLKAIIDNPNLKNKIEAVRTGGQTGFDEAGAKASAKLNIPTKILAPKGWKLRTTEGKDIANETTFKKRFSTLSTIPLDKNQEPSTDWVVNTLGLKAPEVEVRPTLRGQMTFDYGSNRRPGIDAENTLQAIRMGERTATTRYVSDGHLDYWKQAKVGDIVEFTGKNGDKVQVRITKELSKLEDNAEAWSKKEGWSVDYYNQKVKPKIAEAYQMEYELASKPVQDNKQSTINFEPGANEKTVAILKRPSQEQMEAKVKAVYDNAIANPSQVFHINYEVNTRRYKSGFTPTEMSIILDSFPIPDNITLTDSMRNLIDNSASKIIKSFGEQLPPELMNRNEELITSLASKILVPKTDISGKPDGYFSPAHIQETVDSIVYTTQQLLARDPSLGFNAMVRAFYIMQQKGLQLKELNQSDELAGTLGSIYEQRVQFGEMALRKMEQLGLSLDDKSRSQVLENLRNFDQLGELEKRMALQYTPTAEYEYVNKAGEFVEASARGLRDWNDVSFEVDPKNTASGRVKMFIATLPEMDRGSFISRADNSTEIEKVPVSNLIGAKDIDVAMRSWQLKEPRTLAAFAKNLNRKPFWIKGLSAIDNKKVADFLNSEFKAFPKANFIGMNKLVDYEDTFQQVFETLGDRPQSITTKDIVNILKSSGNPTVENVADELAKQDQSLQNEFRKVVSKQYQPFTMLLHTLGKDTDGNKNYTFQIFDSNRHNQLNTLIDNWQQNQKLSDIMIHGANGDQVVDIKRIQDRWLPILTQAQKLDWSKSENLKWGKKAMGNILRASGIDMSEDMIDDLFSNMERWTKGKTFAGGIAKQFAVSTTTGKPEGMFSAFIMKSAGQVTDMDTIDEDALKLSQLNNPLYTEKQAMRVLARVAAKYTVVLHSSNSRNVEGKTIWDWGMNSKLSHSFRGILQDFDGTYEKYQQVDVARNSWLLQMIKDNPAHLERMELSYLDGMRPKYGNRGTTRADMSDREQMLMSLALFQNGGNGYQKISGVNYLSLTHADKTTTPVFKNMPRVDTGSYKDTPQTLIGNRDSVMFNVFKSEYDRIVNQEKADSGNPQYEKGKKLFYFMPEFNRSEMQKLVDNKVISKDELSLIYPAAGNRLTRSIASNRELPVINKVLTHIAGTLTNDTLDTWKSQGITDEKTNMFDKDYVKRIMWYNNLRMEKGVAYEKKGSLGTVALSPEQFNNILTTHAAKDYTLNTYLFNVASSQLLFGDPAEAFKAATTGSEIDNVRTTMKEYGKRLAKDIAPGDDLSWGDNKSYTSITLKDVVSKDKYLAQFPSLDEPYAVKGSEGTDAQEFVTTQEHLDNLFAAGTIPQRVYNEMSKIVKEGNGDYYEFTNPEHLSYILQPMKPVYAGTREPVNGAMLTDYIKSSAYPLYPPLTKGFEMDGLRKMMETNDIQRANYKSAQKLGGPTEPLEIFSSEGKFSEPSKEDLIPATQVLSRDGYRIQQDVPYDEDKNSIKTLSQMNKLVTEGVANIKTFSMPGGIEVAGTDMQTYKEDLRKKLVQVNMDKFNDRFGVEKGQADKQTIYKVLIDEARRKGYSFNELQALQARAKDNTLAIPLWLNNGADRFESLLMSVVNKIPDVQMPGKSYVQGSSVGFTNIKEGKGHDDPNIIRMGTWDGSPLKMLRMEDGQVKPGQVILPFNFFDHKGNRLKVTDFLIQPGDENYEPGVKKIDLSKLPQELLEMVGARIPNQGHSSMHPIEVVGFTPSNSGDLVLVPSGFAKQMGADFDVDKLYTYQRSSVYDPLMKRLSVVRDGESAEALKTKYFDVHYSILTHPDMIEKVLRPLDKPDLKDEAIKLGESGEPRNFYSALSQLDDFQRGKVAKALTAMTSLATTFNADIQQKDLRLGRQEIKEGDNGPVLTQVQDHISVKDEFTGKEMKLTRLSGNGKSQYSKVDGSLSGAEERSKQDNHTTIQSASVDNAKDRTLDNLNLNIESYAAAQALTQLETDDNKAVSLKYVTRLMRQPIIQEYVQQMQIGNDSLSTTYDGALKETVIDKLTKKYGEGLKEDEVSEKILLDPQTLLKHIDSSDTKEFKQTQLAALALFEKLDTIGTRMRELQNMFNQDVNGAGPNLFTALEKVRRFADIGNQLPIMNAEELYSRSDGDTTEKGEIFDHTNNAAIETITQVLPYHKMHAQIEQIRETANRSALTIDQQRDILRALRSHVYTTGQHWWNDAQGDRIRLLYNTSDSKSLGRRLLDAKNTWGKDNYFIARLEPKLGDGTNTPDYIEYQSSSTGTIDEQNNDRGWLDILMSKDKQHRELGEDLLRYTFLTGGRQDANSFVKFVPTSYLVGTEFGDMLTATNKMIENSRAWTPPGFTTQYLQHNPELAMRVDTSHFGKLNGREYPESFRVPNGDDSDAFRNFKPLVGGDGTLVSLVSYRSSLEKKWILYHRNDTGDATYYSRIDTLGNQYTDEYDGNSPTGIRSIFTENRGLAHRIPGLDQISQALPDFRNDKQDGFGNYNNRLSHYEQIGVKEGGPEQIQKAFESISRNYNLPEYLRTIAKIFAEVPSSFVSREAGKMLDIGPIQNEIELTDKDPKLRGQSFLSGKISLNTTATHNIGRAAETFMHEAMHNRLQNMIILSGHDPKVEASIKDDEIGQGFEQAKKEFAQKYPEVVQHVKELARIQYEAYNHLRNEFGEDRLNELANKPELNAEDVKVRQLMYDLSNVQELTATVLTSKGTADYLNNIKSSKGESLLSRVWDTMTNMIRAIAKSIGFKVKDDSLLKEAIFHTLKLSTIDWNKDIDITSALVDGTEITTGTEARAHEIQQLASGTYDRSSSITSNLSNLSVKFAKAGAPKSQVDKIVSKLTDQMYEVGRSFSTTKDPKLRSSLDIKYRQLKEDIRELQRTGDLRLIAKIGDNQMKWVDKVLKNPNPAALDVNLAIKTLDIWGNLKKILYGDLKTVVAADPEFARLQEGAQDRRVALMNDKARTVVADALAGRISLKLADFDEDLKDMSQIEANTITLARAKSLLTQGLAVLGRKEANNRDEEIYRNVSVLEKLDRDRKGLGTAADLMVHEDKDNNAWGLVNRLSGKWFAFTKDLQTTRDRTLEAIERSQDNTPDQRSVKAAEVWKNYWQEMTKKAAFADTRKLFDFETGEKKSGKAYDEYVKELGTKVGSEEYAKELITEAHEKFQDYVRTRESFKDYVQTEVHLSDEEREGKSADEQNALLKTRQEKEFEKWRNYNSPNEFLGSLSKKDFKFSQGDKWLVSAPLGDHTEFYDDNFKKVQANPKLKDVYDNYSSILKEMISYLPKEVQDELPKNFLPVVPKDTVMSLAAAIGKIRNWDETVLQALTATDAEEAARLRPNQIPVMYTHLTEHTKDPANRSTDLTRTLELFSMMALHHKYMANVINEIGVAESLIKDTNARRVSGEASGDPLPNTLAGIQYFKDALIYKKPKLLEGKLGSIQVKLLNEIKELMTQKEALTKQMEDKMVEGDYEMDDLDKQMGDVNEKLTELEAKRRNLYGSKIADQLISINQLKAIGYNPFSAVTNFSFAMMSLYIQASGRTDFDRSHVNEAFGTMLHASKRYYTFGNTTDPVADKVRNLMDRYGIMGDIVDTQYGKSNIPGKRTGALKDSLRPFNWQKSGDYFTKGMLMVAMMKKATVDVTDQSTGEKKTIPLWDAFDHNGKWNAEKYGENPQWQSDDIHDQEASNKFRDKVRKVSTIVYGNQDKNAPLMARASFKWRLAGQFRISWFPEGIMTRFGGERYDADLDRNVKGRYKTYADLGILTSGLLLCKQTLAALPGVKTNPFDGVTDNKGQPISDLDVENMRKNFSGLAQTIALTSLIIGIKALADNRQGKKKDDHDREVLLLVNTLTRNYQDLMQYASPSVFDAVTGNLMPATSVLTDYWKAMHASFTFITNGNPHDKHALEHWVSKMTHAGLPYPTFALYNKGKYMLNSDLMNMNR